VQAISEGGLGRQIRAQRIRRGLTQSQLADLSTVGLRTIRDLEAGRTERPHPITMRLLTSALGLRDDEYAVTAQSIESVPGTVLAADVDVGSGVPAAAGDLVGRANDVEVLSGLLGDGQGVVTIVGFPGSGKTRVAIEVARAVQARMHVLWMRADDNRAADIGRTGRGQRSPSPGRLDAQLSGLAQERPVVLVADGVPEGGWPSSVPRPSHPDVRILVTARRPLGVAGERLYPLYPLAVPTPAVQLLAQAIRRVDPSLRVTDTNDVIAGLCRRLDGVPALLVAVADVVPMLGPERVLEYLCDDIGAAVAETAPDVFAAAQAALADLEPDARDLLRRLCVFPVEWAVGDAARLLDEPPLRVSRRIRALRDLGMIRSGATPDGPRFQLLELVRALLRTPCGESNPGSG
jgi:transcriptional regulator with XRE-family HTH domain